MAPNLYTTRDLATATMLLSRKAVEALVAEARADGRVYHNDPNYDPRAQLGKLDMFDVFQVGVEDGVYLSEDYWVCRRLVALGFPVHVTDAVAVTHYGTHGFRLPERGIDGSKSA